MVKTNNDLDIAAIERFLSGDNNSFNDLIKRYERPIYNLAFRFTNNRNDAADLTQEIFIHLYRKIKSYNKESQFFTWFYRLAVNCCKDWIRKESRHNQTISIEDAILQDDGHSPTKIFEQKEFQSIIQEAISQLPSEQRILIILHDIQGFDYQSIADIESIPIGTVKSRLARARNKLAEIIISSGTY